MFNRIIFYYQTFTSLQPIIDKKIVTHIHLSAIHFGIENNKPYIHLNDFDPENSKFDKLWEEIRLCQNNNIKIILMVGGAGGAFETMFSNYKVYYNLLKNTIIKYNLDGIDLDVEEITNLDNIKMLISDLNNDFGNDFIMSMAPVQYAIEEDSSGMGGFKYKDLFNSEEGKHINYFNVQCYYDFQSVNFENMIKNGYPIEKLVFGMIYSQNLETCLEEMKKFKNINNEIGGMFIWEYCYAENNNPLKWCQEVSNVLNQKSSFCTLC